MEKAADPGLVRFCGSETRVLTLGVLANSEAPLTGYRVAKISNLPQTKVYQELRRGIEAGYVERQARGFRLSDPDLRTLLKKRVRISWSEDWFGGEKRRTERSRAVASMSTSWYDPSRYTPNPAVARRYSREIERPPEKDELDSRAGRTLSRKRR